MKFDGILLLNKPEGLSSNKALQKIKRLFQAKKAGHTGSLDPLATGMLPICFGEATKICHYLLEADKCYQTTGLLGIKTSTADATGEVTSQIDTVHVTLNQLQEQLEQYKGCTKQIPSMYSALKYNGTPLYRLARAGIQVERAARDINISKLELNQFNGKEFSLTVLCSKGTYIRNLVEDIGDSLSVGAHVTRLHRVYTAGFEDYPMYTVEHLEEMSADERMSCLIPMDVAVNYMNSVVLSDNEVLLLRQGRVLMQKLVDNNDLLVRLYDEQQKFIGLGERQANGDLKAKRLLSFNATARPA